MSLLLDALKKAAQDKIAMNDSGARSNPKGESQEDSQHKISRSESGAHSEPTPESQKDDAAWQERVLDYDADEAGANEFEFTLDELPFEEAVEHNSKAPTRGGRIESSAVGVATGTTVKRAKDEKASIAAMHATVTDEALQLLIHKSNVEHRKRQYIIWGSIIIGSLFILMLAGMYFYIDMEDEIVAIQSKNRQALTALAAQTKIEEHLTSLATPVVEPTQNKPDSIKRKPVANQPAVQAVKQKQTLTVQKTEKKDPINELLNRGWTAFQRGEYDSASKAYNKVLQREARNRDALLGIAAVSVRRGETEKARENYLELLELDPLDPYAHAGLASIAQTEGASLSESRLKQLIEKQPDGAHLQFVLGNLYAQQDKWPQAQQAYFSAWQGDNENADYAFNLAVSLDHLKKYNEAERFYQSSLNLAHNRKTGFSVDAVENRLQLLRAVKK